MSSLSKHYARLHIIIVVSTERTLLEDATLALILISERLFSHLIISLNKSTIGTIDVYVKV